MSFFLLETEEKTNYFLKYIQGCYHSGYLFILTITKIPMLLKLLLQISIFNQRIKIRSSTTTTKVLLSLCVTTKKYVWKRRNSLLVSCSALLKEFIFILLLTLVLSAFFKSLKAFFFFLSSYCKEYKYDSCASISKFLTLINKHIICMSIFRNHFHPLVNF